MRVVIFGCGNIGFETIELLQNNHYIEKIFVFNRSYPQYLKELLETNSQESKKITFFKVDAESEEAVENAFLVSIKEKVDVLICTIGVYSNVSPVEYFDQFKSDFNINLYSNIIPIKVAINKKIFNPKARILVISSIAGHYATKMLFAYSPSKWALESLCSTLRTELKSQSIELDIISPTMIRNKHSKVFNFPSGIEPLRVARLIQKLLNKACVKNNFRGNNYFIPFYDYKFHLFERAFPVILDTQRGLKPLFQRKKYYRNMKLESGLITGAASGLGKELAILYSRKLKNLYLVDKNQEGLEKVKATIESMSNCSVSIFCLDLTNLNEVAIFADRLPTVDLLINCAGYLVYGHVSDANTEIYQNIFNVNFFAGVILISKLLNKAILPKKIINILSINAITNPINQGVYSSTKAALWSFTRSLRRVYGNQIQVIEAIASPFSSNLGANRITLGQQISQQKREQKVLIDTITSKLDLLRALNSENVAKMIFMKEEKGEEIIFIPFLNKLVCIKETLTHFKNMSK